MRRVAFMLENMKSRQNRRFYVAQLTLIVDFNQDFITNSGKHFNYTDIHCELQQSMLQFIR